MDAMAKLDELDNYFKILKDVLENNKLMDKSRSIYNVDEPGVLDSKPRHVLDVKGQRKVQYLSTGSKGQITFVGCVSATSPAMPPPFVVFDGKSLNME